MKHWDFETPRRNQLGRDRDSVIKDGCKSEQLVQEARHHDMEEIQQRRQAQSKSLCNLNRCVSFALEAILNT